MMTHRARTVVLTVALGMACFGCRKPVRGGGPPAGGGPDLRRTQANVPLFAIVYEDAAGSCNQAFAPYDEPIRAKVGDKVTFEVLNLCRDATDVALEITSDGDPFNEHANNEYRLPNVQNRETKKRQLLVGRHANQTQDTKTYKFNLLFAQTKIDPRLEVDP